MKHGVRHLLADGLVGVGVGPGDEQAVAGADDALGDCRDLVGRLALAEDDLGEALAGGALVIDPGEPEVFERFLAQNLKEPFLGRLRSKIPCADLVEEGANLLAVHLAGCR